ncbi:hypothetical protein PIIN_07398 [Serendipita indica DSM 11827]|uniref:BTB domain-containing protein n=1 Tax=Serendipita indica (strain DSM 11827) TaxID=1109443 RepID=G4TQ51_SERID|nr:hypothetical protein PIIN_07398 [Serendipita indica DSM 11827]
MANTSKTFPAGYGDLELVSSDSVVFHFPRFLLSHMSPIFNDMFSIAQEDNSTSSASRLTVTEDSKTLEAFLGFLDPKQRSPSLDFAILPQLLEAGRKYEVPQISEWWESQISLEEKSTLAMSFVLTQPMTSLILAFRYGLKDTARLALRELVRAPLSDLYTTMALETTLLSRLLQLRQQRVQWLQSKISGWYRGILQCTSCYQSQLHLGQQVFTLSTSIASEPSLRGLRKSGVHWAKPPCGHHLDSAALFQSWEAEIIKLEKEIPDFNL